MTLDDPDFYASHPDVLPVLECFGISLEPNPYNMVIPDITYKVADIIANDLLERNDAWRQVGWLLKYLTSGTGNSSCDLSPDDLSEFQPLSWDVDDIAFAREIIEEADSIMQDVHAALEWLNQNPVALEALSHNIRKIYQTKGISGKAKMRMDWSVHCDSMSVITQPSPSKGTVAEP